MNIVDVIRKETEHLPPGHTAVEYSHGDISYDALFAYVDQAADVLKGQGVGPGSCVGLSFPDSPDYIILALAILSVGAVMVPVSASSNPDIAADVMNKTGVSFFIFSEPFMPGGDALRVELSCCPAAKSACMGRWKNAEKLPDAFYALQPAFIRFSSGTTGASKGVLLTHDAIRERTDAADKALQITSCDRVLWVLSMSFHFVVSILLFLRRGATIVLCCESFPFSLLQEMRRGTGTFVYASPFHYTTLLDAKLDAECMQSLRMAISTAMKLPADTARAFYESYGLQIKEAYGIIEVGLPFVNAAADCPQGSVGRVLPDYQVEIRNPNSRGVGEVWLRGPGMYSAYVNPWRTRDPGDWFDTGDMGSVDDGGFLFLQGRKKDVINFAGMKLFAFEIEAVIEQHPTVRAALVYPVEDSRYGQIPFAKVEAEDVTEDALRKFCYLHLESYKVPKSFEVVEKLERTQSGKVKRSVE